MILTTISASILSCNHAFIGAGACQAVAAGAHSIHVDVMDGYYVENMTFGPQLVRDLGAVVDVPISVHLEVAHPDIAAPLFFDTPCRSIVFQADACHNPIHLLKKIRSSGKQAGIAVGPAYDISCIHYILHHLDEVLIMSVEPGYAGQAFESSVYEKIAAVRRLADAQHRSIAISVDGGVNDINAASLRQAGADTLICGSYLFSGSLEKNVQSLARALGQG